ncbi:hypothetical protein P885DRAFT_71787 [Corynascus similis CBS 632.67]
MEPIKAKRTLRFYSKVRSGCFTCKKRKVKCDEAKPHCRRCTGTGRVCEGYRPDHASPPMAVVANPASQAGLFASPVERRSFMYFQSQACKPLGGKFNSSFWGREVMQAAIHYPSIRHLVIALGAAYETFEAGTLGQETQLTLQHSNYAIQQLATLNQTPDAPSAAATCCILTASVLFIYLASIRGRFLEAFQHVRSATKVLQDFERSSRQGPDANPIASPTLTKHSQPQWLVTENFVGYDAWDDHFEEILRLCEFIVHKQQQAKIRWGQPSHYGTRIWLERLHGKP